ncbi:hypothetical protein GDO78_017373, partial [Eleutherodactylus coqui]
QLIPQHPVINGAVTLRVTGITEEIVSFTWFKGPNTNSQYVILTYIPGSRDPIVPDYLYNPRITAFSNGSLQIKDLQITDGGNYTVKMQTVITSRDIFVYLTVYETVTKPKITGPTTQPKENDTVTLTCDTSKATTIRWTRRGAHISSEAKLSGDNKTLTLRALKRADSGEYRCEAENLVSKESSDPYKVSVAYGPDKAQIQGEFLVGLGSSITLTCSADSEPDPEYQWRFNGKALAQKASKYVGNAETKDQGLYMCVMRNPVTLRTATVSVYVNVSADTISEEYSHVGLALGLASAIILGVVLIIVESFCLYKKF